MERLHHAISLARWVLCEMTSLFQYNSDEDALEEAKLLLESLDPWLWPEDSKDDCSRSEVCEALLEASVEDLFEELRHEEVFAEDEGDSFDLVRGLLPPDAADVLGLVVKLFIRYSDCRWLEQRVTDNRDTRLELCSLPEDERKLLVLWQGFSHLAWLLADELMIDRLSKLRFAVSQVQDCCANDVQRLGEEVFDLLACYYGGRRPPENGFACRTKAAIEDGLRILTCFEDTISLRLEEQEMPLDVSWFCRDLEMGLKCYCTCCDLYGKAAC